jgi:hypothetical protein
MDVVFVEEGVELDSSVTKLDHLRALFLHNSTDASDVVGKHATSDDHSRHRVQLLLGCLRYDIAIPNCSHCSKRPIQRGHVSVIEAVVNLIVDPYPDIFVDISVDKADVIKPSRSPVSDKANPEEQAQEDKH